MCLHTALLDVGKNHSVRFAVTHGNEKCDLRHIIVRDCPSLVKEKKRESKVTQKAYNKRRIYNC